MLIPAVQYKIFSEGHNIQPFLDFINSLHQNNKFTIEYAKDTFPFSNVEIIFNDYSFDSCIYRKPTHTGQMLHFKALCPDSWKRGLILCLLNIAKRLCSNDNLFHLEIEKLRTMFKLNGYPNYYFNKVLNKFQNPTHSISDNDNSDDVYICLKIPFIGDHSYNLSKKLKGIIEADNKCKVRIIFKSFKVRNYFSLKAKTPNNLLSNVVYKFTCQNDSGITYIGETKRHLITRVGEHLSLSKVYQNSEVESHAHNCPNCVLNASFDSFSIVKKCFNNFDASIHEALLARRRNPALNRQLFTGG